MAMAKDARWGETKTIQVGKDLFALARELQERLNDRGITVEFVDQADELVRTVEGASTGQVVRLGSQVSATLTLEQLIALAARRTGAIRDAIVRKFPGDRALHKEFGVGGPAPTGSMKNALAAIDSVIKGAAKHPTETSAARIIERDLTGLRDLRTAILQADTTQEGAKSGKKSGTAAKDVLLGDLMEWIDDVQNAANLEFVEEPDTLKRFKGLIPTKKAASKAKKAAKKAKDPETPAS